MHDSGEDAVASLHMRQRSKVAGEQSLQLQGAAFEIAERLGIETRQCACRSFEQVAQDYPWSYFSRLSTILSATSLAGTL